MVKSVDPKLLKSRKRGKRGGVRVNMSIKDGRVPLPGIILTSARSVRTKLDELHGLLHTKKVKNLAHLVCITESWLTPDAPHQLTQLNSYEQFRHDRSSQDSGKQSGGGLLLYIEQKWSSNK